MSVKWSNVVFVYRIVTPPQSQAYFYTWKETIWQAFNRRVYPQCHFTKAFTLLCLCEDDLWQCVCVFIFSTKVYQLPPYRDKHFPPNPGPRPPRGAADTEPQLGDVRPAGARPAWGSEPAAGQEIWPGPSSHTPHQVQQYTAGRSARTLCKCPFFPLMIWIFCHLLPLFSPFFNFLSNILIKSEWLLSGLYVANQSLSCPQKFIFV